MADNTIQDILIAIGATGGASGAAVAIFIGLKKIFDKIIEVIRLSKEQQKTTSETILECVKALEPKEQEKPKEKKKK